MPRKRKRKLTNEQQKAIDRCIAERDWLVANLRELGYSIFFAMGELDVENLDDIPHSVMESYLNQKQLKTFRSSSIRAMANIRDSIYDIALRAFIEGHMRARVDDEEQRESERG